VLRLGGRRWLRAVALTVVVLFGFGLRALGLRLGLPYAHHWDEEWIVDGIVHMLVTDSLVPGHFMYGAPLMHLGCGVFHLYSSWVRELSPHDGTMLRWMIRWVSVVISSSGAVGVYLAARWGDWDSRRSAWVGMLAALLYATASELVAHGRYGVTDACLVALTAWTLALTARYVRAQQAAWAVAALVAAGVTVGFKVTAAPTAVIPIAALVLLPARWPRVPLPFALAGKGPGLVGPAGNRWPHRVLLLAAVPILAGTFFALNQSFVHVDHWKDAWGDVVVRALQTHFGGFPEFQLREPGWRHMTAALSGLGSIALHRTPAVSILLAAVSVGGLVCALRERNVFYAIAVAHALIAVAAVAWPNRAFLLRNYLVATPALCLGFGFGVWELARRVGTRVQGLRARSTLAVLAGLGATVLLVVLPLRDAISCQRLSEDPRQRAMDFIAAHAQKGDRIAYTPSVMGDDAMGRHDHFDDHLMRSNANDVKTCREATTARPPLDWIITANYRDGENWVSIEDLWRFQECPGFREVARYEPNPYEHNYAVTATWDGFATAIVLQRQR
jgi:hypothetical protein